ncbi:GntR family transcriptional regulator [Deinococcus sp.]|uniref:GntR family transcriptional regulator n=1 Tax=Deinococcus sp. TaxID=47478 RepID=UPI003CC6AD4F
MSSPPNLLLAHLTLDPGDVTPLYAQLKRALAAALPGWPPGRALPSERDLTQQLGVSRATVRQAISELSREGRLVRRRGLGTFLNTELVEQPLETVSGYSENMRRAGRQASTEVVSAALEPASERVAAALKLTPGAAVAVIVRRRLADGFPLMVERAHLDYALTPGLLTQDLSASLYHLLTERYHLDLAHGEEIIQLLGAPAPVAALLGIAEQTPLLYTVRTVQTEAGRPIEFTERYGRGDRCSFRVALRQPAQLNLREEHS